MLRPEVIQAILDLFEKPSYLEIGVCDGSTFHVVSAARKVAVDIDFAFDLVPARAAVADRDVHFHECSSDDYFAGIAGEDSFDVIFIDGLHSFEQTLRDLLNAIGHLRAGGVIVIDDVIAHTYAASLPTLELSNAFRAARNIRQIDWMGDVYRLVYFIRDYLPGFSFATHIENHGQTVLWRQPRRIDAAPRSIEAISRLSFAESHLDRDAYNIRPFAEIIELLRAR